MYAHSTPWGSKLRLFLLYGQRFPGYGPCFIIAILEHETWQLPKVPEVAHKLSFYPRQSKLSLFLLYGQRFPRYGPFFKIAIYLGMKLGKWPNFQKLNIYSLSNPGGSNWPHSHSTGSGFRDTGRFLKFSYMGMNSSSCTYTLFLPQGVEIDLIFALQAAVSEIRANFHNSHIWA